METFLIQYEKSKNQNLKNKKKTTKERKEYIINSLKDHNNPYSNVWTNKILKINYNVTMEVKGFQNGIPLFRIKKLKEEPKIKPIYNMSQSKYGRFGEVNDNYNNKNNGKRKSKKDEKKNNIKFDIILNHFDNNEKKKSNNKKNKKNKEEKKNNNSNAVSLFNNYDGKYDIRNEKDYEQIKKLIEERNNQTQVQKEVKKLDEINENEED